MALAAWACLAWVVSVTLSSANLDSYHDMLENHAWASPPQWGTHKHPPFFAWVTGAWFSFMPQADWAYRLLSYANVLAGLAGVLALGRRLGLGALASWGALLLLWSFPYTTLAGKFNANSQLLSLWPWAAALLLASWQEPRWRGWLASAALGVVAAAAMLSKYYSGVFLAGLLVPTVLSAQGRRWLLCARPWVALAVFALALWPHLAWVAAHDWAPLTYATSQGDGTVAWKYVVRFALAPLFYWLPAWLALCVLYARHSRAGAALNGQPAPALWRLVLRYAVVCWRPRGAGDVLFWLACMPWALTLGFGVAGVAELSTPWAIPIGYAFALLWLRNLHNAAGPGVTDAVLHSLRRAWWPVVAGVLVLGGVLALAHALTGNLNYYRPTQEAARAIVQQWQARHPGQVLHWVGGDWAENAMLGFYAPQAAAVGGLHTVPGLPDSPAVRLLGLRNWEAGHGIVLCPLGPRPAATEASLPTNTSAPAWPETDCTRQARQWLQERGGAEHSGAAEASSAEPQRHLLTVQRSGWRFPRGTPFGYAVFDVPPATAPVVGPDSAHISPPLSTLSTRAPAPSSPTPEAAP